MLKLPASWESHFRPRTIKSRIDVIRRKKSATLKFLKKDIADLLANGLDINAYGRIGIQAVVDMVMLLIQGLLKEGLMSYKQFIQELEDDILPAEAERRYQEYKSEYIFTQKRAFFDAHRDEEWLRDKYHPTNLITVIERRNELARKVAKDVFLDLQSGTLDLTPGVNALSSNKSGQTSEPNSEDETDIGGKRRRHGHQISLQMMAVRVAVKTAVTMMIKENHRSMKGLLRKSVGNQSPSATERAIPHIKTEVAGLVKECEAPRENGLK